MRHSGPSRIFSVLTRAYPDNNPGVSFICMFCMFHVPFPFRLFSHLNTRARYGSTSSTSSTTGDIVYRAKSADTEKTCLLVISDSVFRGILV